MHLVVQYDSVWFNLFIEGSRSLRFRIFTFDSTQVKIGACLSALIVMTSSASSVTLNFEKWIHLFLMSILLWFSSYKTFYSEFRSYYNNQLSWNVWKKNRDSFQIPHEENYSFLWIPYVDKSWHNSFQSCVFQSHFSNSIFWILLF